MIISGSHFMETALEEAKKAYKKQEVPVGAVICDPKSNRILASTHNLVEANKDPTAHAEILAIRKVARMLDEKRLPGLDIYVTLEPCPMCAQAISFARLRRLYFAAYDPKGGGVEHGPKVFAHATATHKPEIIGGLCEQDSVTLLRSFFQSRR